jgi:hypothetical protein
MDVHLTHYRMVSDILENVDVAKILLIQDTNQISKFVGKNTREVDLEGKTLLKCFSKKLKDILMLNKMSIWY